MDRREPNLPSQADAFSKLGSEMPYSDGPYALLLKHGWGT